MFKKLFEKFHPTNKSADNKTAIEPVLQPLLLEENHTFREIIQLIDKRSHSILTSRFYSHELASFNLDFISSALNVMEFHHKQLSNWDEPYYGSLWTNSIHPRKKLYGNKKLSLDFLTSDIEQQGYNKFDLFEGGLTEVLSLFDCFCYSIWHFLKHTSLYNAPTHIEFESNQFFKEEYDIEFHENFGVTKNILIDFFFDVCGENQIKPIFKQLFKILIFWNLPINKSLAGFPNGNLDKIFEDPISIEVKRHSKILFSKLLNSDKIAPNIFESNNSRNFNDYQNFIPNILDNPEFKDTIKFKALIPEKYK